MTFGLSIGQVAPFKWWNNTDGKQEEIKEGCLDQSKGFQQSFGGMLNLKMSLPTSHTESDANEKVVSVSSTTPWWVGQHQLNVYVSTKGFGGKKVTLCEGLPETDTENKLKPSRLLSKRLGARSFGKSTDYVSRVTTSRC